MATASPLPATPMPGDALASKLGTVARLGDEDLAALHDLTRDSREVPARRNLIREGDRPDHVHLVVEGWAARYKLLPDGGRQILAFLLPGDLCDLHVTVLGQMDHSIATLTRARIAFIPTAAMERLAERPRLTRALWWSALVDEAVLRAWLTSIGRRDALERIGHLFCELFRRLCNVGLATGNGIELPLTQEEIGDALGLTPVHVNRVLQQMRADGLIVLKRGSLEIPDVARLEKVSGFDPSYLHIERRD